MKYFNYSPLRLRADAVITAVLLSAIPLGSHASSLDLFNAHSTNTVSNVIASPNGYKQALVNVNTAPFAVFNAKEPPTPGDDIPNEVQIPLFDGEAIVAVYDRYATGWGGASSWVGHLKSDPSSLVHLSFKDSVMQGNIIIGSEQYQLRYVSGEGEGAVHKLSHLDPSTIPPEHDPSEPPIPDGDGTAPEAGADPTSDTGDVIDVLVVATNDAIAAIGGAPATIVLMDLAISETNTGYMNSGVSKTMRIVGYYGNPYPTSGSFYTDVVRLKNTSDGYMDAIHTTRDNLAADMVALLVDNPSACGRAYAINASASQAFQVTHYGCATGYYSFAHEFGHLQAARHDWAADPTDNSPYTYNHGYVVHAESWRTIMAYNSASCSGGNCTRINYWSNPNKNHPSTGTVMGVPDPGANPAQNYRTLNNTASTVANFRIDQGDGYEPDDTSATATSISDGGSQTHTIHNNGNDEDWLTFDLSCRSKVVIETSGPTPANYDDTTLYLYDSSLTQIAFNDDGGAVRFSKIASGILEAGTYYIKVAEYFDNQDIGEYSIDFDITEQSCMTSCLGMPITVDLNFGQSPTPASDVIAGTPGDDTIFGLNGDDRICGGEGADYIYGQGGNDRILGNAGDDHLYGGSGDDWVDGAAGADELFGQGGHDALYGGIVSPHGYDTFYGGAGNDSIRTETSGGYVVAGGNNDSIYGSSSADVIYGNAGLDTLRGYDGADYLYGGLAADTIYGGDGDDRIYGEGHRDQLYGENGNDIINGGTGNDSMDGGNNTDECNGQGGTDSAVNCETTTGTPLQPVGPDDKSADAPPASMIPDRVYSEDELNALDNCDRSLEQCLKN